MHESPPASAPTRTWADRLWDDRAGPHAVRVNQLLLATAVLLVTLLVINTERAGDRQLYFTGVALVWSLTVIAFAVPWSRVPVFVSMLIPIVDIVAITVMRLSDPTAGYTLLWMFPVLWLCGSFGTAGYFVGVGFTLTCYFASSVVQPVQGSVFSLVLLPVVIVVVGTTTYLSARRSRAQERLLDSQATMLRTSLERARRHEQLVTDAIDSVDFGIVRIESDGSLSMANEAYTRLSRQRNETVVYADAEGTTVLDEDQWPISRARRGEAFDDQRLWVRWADGREKAFSVGARRILEGNRDIGAVMVTRDVTAETAALRERDALVSSVSHELRTPLTSIMGFVELAGEVPGLPPAAADYLAIADRNAEQLLALVGDVLAASSTALSGAQLPLTPSDVDAGAIARAAVESLAVAAADRDIDIDADGIGPAPAYADPVRLQQVFHNLLSNAIKYNRAGGHVAVATRVTGETTEITVSDTGVGLSDEDLAGVFQRYYRGAAVGRAGVSGNGLGLAISRDIVRRHGGDITVTSTLGLGATFTVILPALRPGRSPGVRP
ncbi:HAMP domain-containing histidine kinase [Microbacterium sp. W1N]|uniref:sensor histidine kinase n=1 Tax=Microbacterium festucae TaxID=2977531 RepID=UPI0021C16CB4|nr:HAMP domain-containing sensor histidine kinase [Microbacterium festucae]MCT9819944.1 HAMP domain-containing histidine kinase [Microbacterium festucae]